MMSDGGTCSPFRSWSSWSMHGLPRDDSSRQARRRRISPLSRDPRAGNASRRQQLLHADVWRLHLAMPVPFPSCRRQSMALPRSVFGWMLRAPASH